MPEKEKRKHYSKLPAKLPVLLTIKFGGNIFKHILKDGDKLKCIYCGKEFTLDNKTAFTFLHPHDKNVRIECPECKQSADAVYYADKNNRTSIKAWDSKLVKTTM